VSTLLEADVGQMRLSAGEQSPTSATGRFDEPRGRRRGQQPGVLYVLAAVEDDAQETIAQTLVKVVGKAYQSARGSLTSRLIRAIEAGSAALLQDNLSLVSRSPRRGGVACALVRQDDLYLAQAGATIACVYQRGTLDCQANDEPDTELKQAFGRRRDPDVRLAYHTLKPGGSVMLASTDLIQQAGQETLVEALGFASARLSLDNLAAALPTSEGVVLVLAARGRGAPSSVRPAATAPGAIDERPHPRPRPAAPREAVPEKAVEPPPPPAPAGPTLEERLASVREGVRRGVATAGHLAGDWLRRLMPGEEGPYRGDRRPVDRKLRRQASPANEPNWRWIALGLPAIVALVVVGSYWKRGWDRQAQYDDLMVQLDEQLAIAATADETTARMALETALALLEKAAKAMPQSQEVPRLQASVQEQLDTLNRALRLEGVEPLYTYPATGEADQIVVHGTDIYVLDRLADRVYHHRLNGSGAALASNEERVLVRRGDRPDGTTAVGDLVGMVWMPGGESHHAGALLILGRNGLLLVYEPTWERLAATLLPASETWQYPVAVSGYRGNFYILDPGLQQVLRYRPSGGGYTTPPESYFTREKPDMTAAIDMAIDGFIYLLFQDGRLEKYLAGDPAPLEISRLDKPLQYPSAIYAAPDEETQFLYLAEHSFGRVLRCDKQGLLIHQFVIRGSDALNKVRDIFVDEVGGRIYFLSDNQLFMITIPPS